MEDIRLAPHKHSEQLNRINMSALTLLSRWELIDDVASWQLPICTDCGARTRSYTVCDDRAYGRCVCDQCVSRCHVDPINIYVGAEFMMTNGFRTRTEMFTISEVQLITSQCRALGSYALADILTRAIDEFTITKI